MPIEGLPGWRNLSSRLSGGILIVYIVLWCGFVSRTNQGFVGHIRDDGIYLVTARSLHAGTGYRLLSRPGEPKAGKYSPGFPALLAAAFRAAGSSDLASDIVAARFVVAVAGGAFLFLGFRWLLGFVPPAAAFFLTLVLSFNPMVVDLSTSLMSDIVFADIVLAGLLVLHSEGFNRKPGGLLQAAAFGIMAALSFVIRGNGVALMVSGAAQLWRKRRWPATAASVAGLLLVALPGALLMYSPGGARDSASYKAEISAGWSSWQTGVSTAFHNAVSIHEVIPVILFPVLVRSTPGVRIRSQYPIGYEAVEWLITALFLAGLAALAKRFPDKLRPAGVYALVSLAIFVVWPWPFSSLGPRFLVSLFPLILLTFIHGATMLPRNSHWRSRAAAAAAMCLLLGSLLPFLSTLNRAYKQHGFQGDPDDLARMEAAINLAKTKIPVNSVLISGYPELFFLYTGLQGIPILEDDDWLVKRFGRWDRIEEWMRKAPGREFYILSPDMRSDLQLAALLNAGPMRIERISQSGSTFLGRLILTD